MHRTLDVSLRIFCQDLTFWYLTRHEGSTSNADFCQHPITRRAINYGLGPRTPCMDQVHGPLFLLPNKYKGHGYAWLLAQVPMSVNLPCYTVLLCIAMSTKVSTILVITIPLNFRLDIFIFQSFDGFFFFLLYMCLCMCLYYGSLAVSPEG